MLKINRIHMHLALSMTLAIVFLGIYLILLQMNSSQFSKDFYSQNFELIEAGNAFGLIPQLNSLTNQGSVSCISAKFENSIFFTSKCAQNLWGKTVIINGNNIGIKISLLYNLNQSVSISLSVVLIATLVFSNLILISIFKMEDLKNQTRIKIANIARQVAHDIRSPLTALNMISNSLANINNDHAQLVTDVVNRINSIANDLLQESKIESFIAPNLQDMKASKTQFSSHPENQCKAIAEIKALVKEKTAEYGTDNIISLELRNHVINEDIAVKISSHTLCRILSNIINNSIEAITTEGKIFLELTTQNNNLNISVIDFGKGIPENIVSILGTTPFSQNKKDKNTGNGIGLYSAKQLLSEVGGSLSIQSRENIGTKITISIPIA